MSLYWLHCPWCRKCLDASSRPAALAEACEYAARNGLTVRLAVEDAECERLVATIRPTWVASTVLNRVLGDTMPDAADDIN